MSRAGLSTAIDADEHPLIRERGCLGCEKLLYYKEVKEIIIKKLSNSNIECEYILSQMVTLISLQDLIEIEKLILRMEMTQRAIYISFHIKAKILYLISCVENNFSKLF